MVRTFSMVFLAVVAASFADRRLEPAETEQLLQTLTLNPRQSWLPYGMITARHLQYQDFENKITDSTETIYFDGQRYCWEVSLNPDQSLDMNRSDSLDSQQMQPPSEDFLMNRSNLYLWNGQKQVRYYKASAYAVVTLGQEDRSQSQFGPPTAGIIPWGHGDCSLAVLRTNAPAAYELSNAEGTRILLEYTETKYRPAARISFLLDPAMDYAVLSYSVENDLALLRNTYNDYQRTGSFWIPAKIMIERFDKRSGAAKLLSYDDWQFQNIVFEKPEESRFVAGFETGTVVEMQPSQSMKTFMYQASEHLEIEPLLEDKIAIMSADPQTPGNCATAVISHVARKFSKTISPERMAQLVSSETRKTTLADFKAAIEEAGLECMAVTTDIASLGKFSNCVKIVHLPGSNHYAIVDRVEQDAVWVIDLVNRKFYWKKQMDEFLLEWSDGTALLVANSPINVPLDTQFNYLEAAKMSAIQGGDFGTYSCSDQIQITERVLCDLPIGFLCGGAYYKFYERYGCKEDANGSTCVGQKLVGYEFTHCINNINDGCTITGIWESRFIRACQ